jgi:hypothetical protein
MELTRAAADEVLRMPRSGTFQLFVITDGEDNDSASISPASTAQAITQRLAHLCGWTGHFKFSSCLVVMGADSQFALAPRTRSLDPQNDRVLDNITEGFRRVINTIARVTVQQTQSLRRTLSATGGRTTGV